jgi:uncharacterized damage-inducible protein DinB
MLFTYHFHTTIKLLESAQHLPPAVLQADPGYGRGSIQALLLHLLAASYSWRIGLDTGERPTGPRREDYETLDAIAAGLEKEESSWQGCLEGLRETETSSRMSSWAAAALH